MGWIKKQAKKLKKHVVKTMEWDPATDAVLGLSAKKEAAALAEEQANFAVSQAQSQANATAEAARASILQLQSDQTRAKMAGDMAKSTSRRRDESPDVEIGGVAQDAAQVLKRRNQFRPTRKQ
jgi:hypothetical protein